MSWNSYGSVDVLEGDPGVIYVQYNNIYDLDFVEHMMQYVMPAGYQYRIESGDDTREVTGNVYRNRLDFMHSLESKNVDQTNFLYENSTVSYRLKFVRTHVDPPPQPSHN